MGGQIEVVVRTSWLRGRSLLLSMAPDGSYFENILRTSKREV
jgi:hypothetical protein